MLVKICGITRREDAVAAVRAGATALGFNFYQGSPRYIPPREVDRLVAGLNVIRVGVFVNASSEIIAAATEEAKLDVVQLHGDEPPQLLPASPRIWKAFRVNRDWNPKALDLYNVEAFLLDGPAPGSGQAFDWAQARFLRSRIILAGGLGPDNIAAAIREIRPWGVDACSRLESAPGTKDHFKMCQFIETALSES